MEKQTQGLNRYNVLMTDGDPWSVRLHDDPDLKVFILVGWDRSFCLLLGPSGLN